MGMQLRTSYCLNHFTISPLLPSLVHKHTRCSTISQLSFKNQIGYDNSERAQFFVAASNNADSPFIGWDEWKPEMRSKAPSLSDVLWPSAGAFAAMAMLGKMDQVLAPRGVSMTIAPFGAVCAVLFATPSSPAARKYNMFLAQIGCAVIGVLAFSIFGPGWLARSTGLAAAIAFMIYTRAIHPPAASLPLLFVDGAKLHGLNFWFAFFPGAAGCIVLWLIQEIVCFLKDNFKF
ncbi:uncharacterized protein LOC131299022 isoform X1 [Rhododendron vialii]|uniref:uncharacterized protein LOC131299022 isoform X1 n=1 Tax=Rhododendron vialii TaxID=182163 RepID=UPI00265DC348|nr:uncharacterized protein LOC131299022 isoform X1 [Rhododendron vialii]